MMDLRYVVSIVLLLVDGLWKIIKSGCSYETLEEQIQRLGQQVLTGLFTWTLEKIDEEILKTRDKKRYECINFKERTGVTIIGEFTIRRRMYRDRDTGAYCFLLDEALGWPSRQRLSPKMRETALELGTEMPFRRAAKIINRFVPGISAMIVWDVVKQAGEDAQARGEANRQTVFEGGEIPEGKYITNTLFLEADGIIVNQQRSKNKKAEIRLLTGYDGKQISRTGRCVLKHRYSVAATRDADSFWEESSAHLANQWNISKVERVELGGDGADWIKQGSELFPNTVYHLDRYHLRQRLTEALASNPACHRETITGKEDVPHD